MSMELLLVVVLLLIVILYYIDWRMKSALCLLALSALTISCSDNPSPTQAAKPYVRPTALTLDAHTTRTDDGRVVVSGTTNLPDGLKMWIEVQQGRLPLGAPKVVASDANVIVKDGKFASNPLWLAVPNTRFARKGWPKNILVNDRLRPFPDGKIKVHFESIFNSVWQTSQVLTALGGEGGKKLKGPILKATDTVVIDSPMAMDYLLTLPLPPISPGAKAISLVRAAILTVPDNGRSSGDIQANLDLFLSSPGLRAGKGWTAKAKSQAAYEVSYDFVDEKIGEQQALWTANLTTGEVNYRTSTGKYLVGLPITRPLNNPLFSVVKSDAFLALRAVLDQALLKSAPPVAFRAFQNFALVIIEPVEVARTHSSSSSVECVESGGVLGRKQQSARWDNVKAPTVSLA
jgi:hypothetical protein